MYFHPPETVKIKYPCIVYKLDNEWTVHANDSVYHRKKKYIITVIDRTPDSKIPDEVRNITYCSFDRAFSSDNLNHFVFSVYH